MVREKTASTRAGAIQPSHLDYRVASGSSKGAAGKRRSPR
jgi:hypothetical protein